MAEETGTSGCESATISVSNTHDKCSAKDNADHVTTSYKRRRVVVSKDEDHHENTLKVSKHKFEMNSHENPTSTSHDHVISSCLCSANKHDSIPDLIIKAKCIPKSGIFISLNKSFRDVSRTSSTMRCLESEEMADATNEAATSCRKPSPVVVAKMPSAEELEEFFAKAEKYEQKRFADKYNFDIVKDVPIEGRYQWIKLKP
uniref:cyclin-dependent kinase inhibitor 7-like n=1 Tax=Erigeron canadensis TaxID=72917 RepID=UPI001CB8F7A5|nr:cyclin-dependent kinase inhibitor 7-like [Erigeron canadensis]